MVFGLAFVLAKILKFLYPGFGFGCKAAFIEGKSVPLFRDSAPAKEVIEKGTSLPGFIDLRQTWDTNVKLATLL